MPSYRGVEQADLIKSINEALELLETHSPGPVCQQNIDKLRAVDPATNQSPLGALAAAMDDQSLVEAVGKMRWTIGFMGPMIRYHGLNDTDGKGVSVYKQLGAWGATSGARDMAYHEEDGEMDSYLATQYAKKLAQKMPVITGLKNIFWAAATNGRDGLFSAHKLNRLVRKARRGADDAEIVDAFLQLDIRDRHLVVDAAAAACHMHWGQKNNLPEVECMSQFGLVIPELGKSLNWGSPEAKELAEKVQKVLEPFWASDEVQMVGIGVIGMTRESPQGIMFGSTRRAAQAVKEAFPDMDVIDYKGRSVELPAAKPATPESKPQP
ncbi:MAG: hypothetical protein EPN97_05860 [Alphaproteobacteria bacterium]|nr:MAG: hypothetical protein EPN97_05860 [Alphaproteobacteria bacterium]